MRVSTPEILGSSILIVDDQPANVLLLQRLLTEAGYTQVSSTTVPSQVRQLHVENHYDLILLDLHMPSIDGFEVMRLLRVDGEDDYLPVIVLTAHLEHKQKALEAGARDFISKPFDFLEVKTRIRNMLEVRQLYRHLERHAANLERAVAERTAQLQASETRFRRLTELASDWYWEQNETGDFSAVSGPVLEVVGLRMGAYLGDAHLSDEEGWDLEERRTLKQMIARRQPFVDYTFSRRGADGVQQHFRVSGEPMLDAECRFVGFRGIGAEVRLPQPAQPQQG